jgi:Mn-containing catalase
MILRYDRLGIEIPSGDPDPAGAMAVQELMGGRFGEMSTLMNYTFQSFGFRGRKELRPFYDLIANIAAEEYGHIEAVGATITTMLTGTDARQVIEQGNPHHVLKAGKGVLPIDAAARRGPATTCSPPGTSSRTSRTTTSSRPGRATAS